ncbi:hypothetical protein DM01DRAFT_1273869, partial [Hesseltinella vesiculosa]
RNKKLWIRGKEDFSLMVEVTHLSNDVSKDLYCSIRQTYPNNTGIRTFYLGRPRSSGRRRIAEVCFDSKEECVTASQLPIIVQGYTLHPSMALSPDADMAIVKVSDIPMRNTEFLQSSLDTLFRRFGYILDIELHNTAHGDLFTGKATVVLDRSKPHDSCITDWSPLGHKLPWVTGTRNLLCSYEGMADFCSFCHEPGHARNAC